MSHLESGRFNTEPTPEQPPIDKAAVLDKLLGEVAEEYGIDIVVEDIEWLSEEIDPGDDNDFLAWLVSLAGENGIDHEEFLEHLGIAI
jgi:hypothetical protein